MLTCAAPKHAHCSMQRTGCCLSWATSHAVRPCQSAVLRAIHTCRQFLDNIKNQSAEALSVWFLAQWFLGDTLNLLGCLMSGDQLATTTALAMYFVLSDVIMLTQYVYYGALQRRARKLVVKAQRRMTLKRQSAALMAAAAIGPDGTPLPPGQLQQQQRRHTQATHRHHHHHHRATIAVAGAGAGVGPELRRDVTGRLLTAGGSSLAQQHTRPVMSPLAGLPAALQPALTPQQPPKPGSGVPASSGSCDLVVVPGLSLAPPVTDVHTNNTAAAETVAPANGEGIGATAAGGGGDSAASGVGGGNSSGGTSLGSQTLAAAAGVTSLLTLAVWGLQPGLQSATIPHLPGASRRGGSGGGAAPLTSITPRGPSMLSVGMEALGRGSYGEGSDDDLPWWQDVDRLLQVRTRYSGNSCGECGIRQCGCVYRW